MIEDVYEVATFVHNMPMQGKGHFKTLEEAKEWAAGHVRYGDDVYVIFKNGLVFERRMVEYMWQED